MFKWLGSSAGRGGHSGGGNRSDEERKGRKRRPPTDPVRAGRVASDGGRKRGARRFTNRGEVEEYGRRMEMPASDRGGSRYEHVSSSGAGSSSIARAPLPPPKREEEEEHAPRPGLLPGDFADDEHLDWITAEVIERSKQQQQEEEADRQMKKELEERRVQAAIHESLHPVIELSSESDFDFASDSD